MSLQWCLCLILINLATAALAVGKLSKAPFDISRAALTDLTHPLNANTIFWPSSPLGFELKKVGDGKVKAGHYYAANSFCMPEHGGTHLDAPLHFAEGAPAVGALPLNALMGESVVMNISAKTLRDRDYTLTVNDIKQWEASHGNIPAQSFVLLLTGWGKFWGDRRAYLGDDKPEAVDNLHFPAFSEEAAAFLLSQRHVKGLGIDTASVDHGPSRDFKVHRHLASHGAVGLENLANLDLLPVRGAFIMALPMKIEAGTGAPARVIAFH